MEIGRRPVVRLEAPRGFWNFPNDSPHIIYSLFPVPLINSRGEALPGEAPPGAGE